MASSSGSKGPGSGSAPRKSLSRKMTRLPTTMIEAPEEDAATYDSEIVPSSLASIVPFLRVANEVEPDNPRVAYLCRFRALERVQDIDPTSSGRGVRQFKTYLLHRLEKDEEKTKQSANYPDRKEIQFFYKWYFETFIRDGATNHEPEEMPKHYQTASVLYDVLKTVIPLENADDEIIRYAAEVERNKVHYAQYNILPLHYTGTPPPIMEFPEIKAAVNSLRNISNLPMPSVSSTAGAQDKDAPNNSLESDNNSVRDLLDWLGFTFGFQKGNVENQREHLILLLANIDMRKRAGKSYTSLDDGTVRYLGKKVFQNYKSWCAYLHEKQTLKFPGNSWSQQLELLYIGLYFLIWGEASNIRFMPECVCYIFYHMAKELFHILYGHAHIVTGAHFEPTFKGKDLFLRKVITPIYQVLRKEVQRNKGYNASHSKWGNYDDLNEYFWSKECFNLGWPMELSTRQMGDTAKMEHSGPSIQRRPKRNFVEVRTFWHLFRSFDRMWTFFILAFQAMVIIAWSPTASPSAIFEADVFRSVLSIFLTAALLNFIQAVLDIILSWKAWGNMVYSQIARYLLKFVVAAAWLIIMPISYSSSMQNPTGLVKFFRNWFGNSKQLSFYGVAVVIYLLPNILSVLLFLFPSVRRSVERSNWSVAVLFVWWAQPKLYVGRGMHEDMVSLLRYTLFWILLLISKLAFSYYVEILPLIEPTKVIMNMRIPDYDWHEFFPNVKHNIGVIISIWTPIVLVYFMDAQIWYAIFSTLFGGILGAFSHLGEIRTLGMLRSRFDAVPLAFSEHLVPSSKGKLQGQQMDDSTTRMKIAKFSHVWNNVIISLRMEDLISDREKDLLLLPYSSDKISVVQWPPFLLASKIPVALDMAKDIKGKDDNYLFKKIHNDEYMSSAIIECYQTLKLLLSNLLVNLDDKNIFHDICLQVEMSIVEKNFLTTLKMSELPQLSNKVEKLLSLLIEVQEGQEKTDSAPINVLQDIMEIMIQDVMTDGQKILEKYLPAKDRPERTSTKTVKALMQQQENFTSIDLTLLNDCSWMEKVVRLHLLISVKESAINVPMNLDARRRITFFANSVFMKMPRAPEVWNMLSFSVLTPYFKEDVLYSEEELNKENEDGISILFYLQKIYPDEWKNFLQRINVKEDDLEALKEHMDDVRHWVSYRGQTLSKTVRGMMYYKRALELQASLDMTDDSGMWVGLTQNMPKNSNGQTARQNMLKYSNDQIAVRAKALADMKFTYVVSCQAYGMQKKSANSQEYGCYRNILNLMIANPSLRVAYIDEREETVDEKTEKVYYSVLLKGGDKLDEEIYRIRLPGPPIDIGEGKPENQNHAIIFTRGEALQTIDMNQDNYLEEAFKIRNVLEEFVTLRRGQHGPTILGLREHIFTGSVSSLAWFMSNQEMSFVTIGQRILANPLKVRFHYGHPDIFDRLFHITRGGISKASKIINLSEDIFSGFNSTLRGGSITHHEYMQVGKGRDVGMNQISSFEAKVANGNGEQTISRDVYRLGRRFDFFRMLSFYFTTVGFYFSSMVTVLTLYTFLYGQLYMVMSGLERAILEKEQSQQNTGLETALASQSIFQLGLLLVLPMVMEIGLEKGFRTALGEFIIMQLQLASVFFTFQLGTKVHYYGRTILHGGAKYRATGRGFVVFHAKFADNYRLYSRSHFVKGLELIILLVVYQVYGPDFRSNVYLFVTMSMWFLVASWLFAPFVFNPSGFEWQKTVDDWTDWNRWMGNRGGIGIAPERSWESWWEREQEHLKHTSHRGRLLEIILALRFLLYQYGIVYHLNIAHHSRSVLVYGLSWLVMVTVLLVLKMVSMGRRRFGTDFQLMFRILKGLLFLGFVSVMTVLFVVCGLTISDVFAGILGFMPTGWALLLIGQACRSLLKKVVFWDSIMELARAYEYVMGTIIFTPIVVLSWFPFVSEFQTRLLFNQAFSRGLQISRILSGRKDVLSNST